VFGSKTVSFEPKESSDVDTDPFCRTIDWFYRSGTVHRFQRPSDTTAITTWDDPDKNTSAYTGNATCQSTPYPETDGRWLLITANNYTSVATDVGWTSAVAPSFDLNLETQWKQQS